MRIEAALNKSISTLKIYPFFSYSYGYSLLLSATLLYSSLLAITYLILKRKLYTIFLGRIYYSRL
jgi:hypothetical protein